MTIKQEVMVEDQQGTTTHPMAPELPTRTATVEANGPAAATVILDAGVPSTTLAPTIAATNTTPPTTNSTAYQHRPRLVRKPSPALGAYQPIVLTTTHLNVAQPATTTPLQQAAAPMIPQVHPLVTTASWSKAVKLQMEKEQRPSTGSLFDDDADDEMEIDFHAIDVDAIAAAALIRQKSVSPPAPPPPLSKATLDHADMIDLTDSQPESTETKMSIDLSSIPPPTSALMDIEDLAPPPVPLSLRPSPPLFFVTDFSAMNWCEKQVDLALRLGKRKPLPQAQAVMDAGIAIHLAYELETVEKVNIEVETSEDIWALRLLNMMMGVQELSETGRTRELPVFGCIQVPVTETNTQPIWIMGIIDEVVRLDLFESEMHRKAKLRDAMPPIIKSPRKKPPEKETAASTTTVTSSSAPATGAAHSTPPATSEKRKRENSDDLEGLFDSAPKARPSIADSDKSSSVTSRSISCVTVTITTSVSSDLIILNCDINIFGIIIFTIQPAPSAPPPSSSSLVINPLPFAPVGCESHSQSLLDMDLTDDDFLQLFDTEDWNAKPKVKTPQAPLPSKPPPKFHRSASLPPLPPPRPPSPKFPVSPHHVIMDHKTRASNSMPHLTQKIGTYLQISIYKLLLDRWFGPDRGTKDEERKSNDQPPLHSILEDPNLPPFPLEEFFRSFKLNSSRRLGTALQTHMANCGLSSELTLGQLLLFTLASFKTVHRTYKEMKVEYEYQKDGRHIGSDTYTFDRKWLAEELHHHMTYWFGFRAPAPVPLCDGFKCTRCDYVDVCDDRIEKYKRVGRLIRPPPIEADSTATADESTKMELVMTDVTHIHTNITNATGTPSSINKQEILTNNSAHSDQPNQKRQKKETSL